VTRTRAGLGLAAGALAAALAGVAAVPAAAQQPGARTLPRHPEVTAVVTCEAKVSYGVMSWVGVRDDPATSSNERDESRTTPQVAVSYSVDGGRNFVDLPLDPKHRLDKAGGFHFLGTFPLPTPLPRAVIVRARAASAWADGTGFGQAKQFGPVIVPQCAGVAPAPLTGFAGAPAAATARPTPQFDPEVVGAAALAMLVLLVVGLWARGRVGRP
jgi:hypothetical protein